MLIFVVFNIYRKRITLKNEPYKLEILNDIQQHNDTSATQINTNSESTVISVYHINKTLS